MDDEEAGRPKSAHAPDRSGPPLRSMSGSASDNSHAKEGGGAQSEHSLDALNEPERSRDNNR